MSIINSIVFQMETKRINAYRQYVDQQLIGYKFSGLDEFLKGVEIIGYYTGTNLKEEEEERSFIQAQYMLAPILIEFNNLNHEYILFVCKDESLSWIKIKELGLEPLRRNKYGIILAKHPA